jgi:hypothetical protein
MKMDLISKKLNNKVERIRNEMREYHPEYSHNGLLNIAFRHGDGPHSQFTFKEECTILPLLVQLKHKKVATIPSTNIEDLQSVIIPEECCSVIIFNRWKMYVLVIYHKDDECNVTLNKIDALVNETDSFKERGYLYGYY